MSKQRVHILGICGTFMGCLALIARELGFEVTGSDENIYPPMSNHLLNQGIKINQGYKKSDLPEADVYLVGNSLSRGNPSVEFILESKLTFSSGPDWLANNILKHKKVIAVAGTHGKTTTSAMLTWIFEKEGFDVGYLIAGIPKNFEKSSRIGSNEIFIIEADEYDTAFFDKRAKFIHYSPDLLIINNIEFDHADIYSDISDIRLQFHHLIRTMASDSHIIFPNFDKQIKKVLRLGNWSNLICYGKKSSEDNYLKSLSPDYSSIRFSIGKVDHDLNWNLFGEYNAYNALAAILAADRYGISISSSISALESFSGVFRRQDILIHKKDVTVIDDFAHHPTAIMKTLQGIRKRFKKGKIIALIELRSNTMKSGLHNKDLIKSVTEADMIFWKGKNRKHTADLVKSLPQKSKSIFSIDQTINEVKRIHQSGDTIVIMSNGNFEGMATKLCKAFN